MDKVYNYLLIAVGLLFGISSLFSSAMAADQVYQDSEAFLQQAFAQNPPAPKLLWITAERRQVSHDILGHAPTALRLRYWQQDQRSVWILEEVGKELPITVGIVINQQHIEQVKVLVFRESRGWEVRHDFFTQQFQGTGLSENNQLNQSIDGISGATLSVRALKKVARLALYYDQQLQANP